jgi:putative nucleotidyltransferase with HDIG domain
MPSMDELRAGVLKSLPEINNILNDDLRQQVIAAWAKALSETEYNSLNEIQNSALPLTPILPTGTQADHLRGVACMALAMVNEMEAIIGSMGVDRDILLACALCHDLGKPFEFSHKNQQRWMDDPSEAGYPAIRHSVYGVHIALSVGLPEQVAHCCGAHSGEGELIQRSLETTIVHHADKAWWRIIKSAGMLNENHDVAEVRNLSK